jgi:hypothetical protein
MTPDIPTLITKLRNAPQLVGTFGRGDPDPLDEYRPGMTGEERDWLVKLLEAIERRRGVRRSAVGCYSRLRSKCHRRIEQRGFHTQDAR